MHIEFIQTVLHVTFKKKLKFKGSLGSVEILCVGERVDTTRVWCLVAEGDYVRIRVSLCLLRSGTEMEDITLVRACVYVCVCGWWEYNCLLTFA